MNRLGRALKASFFPLLVAVGIAALAAGYLEWRRFFAELYLEEVRAIDAAVAAGAEVEYRRAGEPRSRVASRTTDWQGRVADSAWERERTTVPDNAPFLGRVESIKLRERPYGWPTTLPTKTVRDGMLRLPGLRSFEGRCDDAAPAGSGSPGSAPDASDSIEQALRQPLPELPEPTLTVSETEAPLPHGEALDASARAELAATIAAAWKRKRPLKTYVARSAHRPNDSDEFVRIVTEISDGERFVSRIERPASADAPPVNGHWSSTPKPEALRLLDEERAYAFAEVDCEWRRIAAFDLSLGEEAFDRQRFAPALASPATLPRLDAEDDRFGYGPGLSLNQDDPLGEAGSEVVAIERIDDSRLLLKLAPQPTTIWEGTFDRQVELIVREDMGFAVERFQFRLDAPSDEYRQGFTLVKSVSRRLARADEAIYAQEMLRSDRIRLHEPVRMGPRRETEIVERTLTAIVAAPEIPAAVFDPLSYDPTVWPEPRTLPTIRNYRTLWSLGAGLIAVGTIGPLLLRRRTRRFDARVEDLSSRTADAPARLPRFRFGLAALFAAALATISVADAIKQIRDVVLRDVETLRRIDGWAEIERHEARFPWSLFSTPGFPLDAPLKRIAIGAMPVGSVPPASDEVVAELLANPRLESFVDYSVEAAGEPREYVLADAAAALSRSLPTLPERIPPPETALWLEEMPEGEPLSAEEASAFVGRLANAWQKMSAAFRQSYLLIESHDHYGSPEARATLRSGERCWAMGGSARVFVSSQSDRHRYRFGTRGDGFSLVEKTRLDSTPLDLEAQSDPYGYGRPVRSGFGESPFRIDQPGRAADPPFAFPRYLYDEIESFEEVARAALDPAKIERVSRLDDGRYRIDFDSTEIELQGKPWDIEAQFSGADYSLDWIDDAGTLNSTDADRISIAVAELAAIVREDMDYAVERTYLKMSIDTRQNDVRSPDGSPRGHRFYCKVYVTNRLVRTPEGIVVPESSRVGDDRGGSRTWWDSRFAYDFSPEIDERIFTSPSMSDLEPYPIAKERRTVTWPLATGALSIVLFAGLGGRRVADAVRSRMTSDLGRSP